MPTASRRRHRLTGARHRAGSATHSASPRGGIVTKVLAGRPKDVDDACGVLREQGGRLDIERSRRFLRLLEQALDRSDLVCVLDQLLEG